MSTLTDGHGLVWSDVRSHRRWHLGRAAFSNSFHASMQDLAGCGTRKALGKDLHIMSRPRYSPADESFCGPNLHDVYKALAGTRSLRYGHKYYPPIVAAREAGLIWTDENLNQYLKSPEHFLKSATGKSSNDAFYMNLYIGGQDDGDVRARGDVIAFLREIKGRPCECAVPSAYDMSCGRP